MAGLTALSYLELTLYVLAGVVVTFRVVSTVGVALLLLYGVLTYPDPHQPRGE